MEYRRVGKSGLSISEIGLGSWISCDDLSARQTSIDLIRTAFENGVTYFDTADCYSDGRAEMILGEALGAYPRGSYVLATKVYWPVGAGANERGLSRKHILEAVDQSLKRLKTDYIDIYYCHWFDKDTDMEETLRAMDHVVRQGKALYIGVSNWTAAQIAEGMRICGKYLLYPITANQPSYNMLDRYIEAESMPICKRAGIGQIVYSPLAQGVLSGKYRPGQAYPKDSRIAVHGSMGAVSVSDYLRDDILDIVARLNGIAAECGLSMPQLALAWALRKSNVSCVITGASRGEQVRENIGAAGVKLPGDLTARIEEILSEMKGPVKHNIIPY